MDRQLCTDLGVRWTSGISVQPIPTFKVGPVSSAAVQEHISAAGIKPPQLDGVPARFADCIGDKK
jgi:hypothetical protein